MLTILWPWLALALPLPWLVARYARPAPAGGAIRLPDELAPTQAANRGRPSWLAVAAWLCLLTATLRPVWLGEPITLPAAGRDILLAVDLSGSMDERDILLDGKAVQRLAVVQQVAGDFIERRRGDRIGLILFGEQAYLQSPLSLDRQTTRQLLAEAEVGLAGRKTAVGDAIGLGVKHLLEAGRNPEKVLVLLTDGENTAGAVSPDKAAELAAQSGVRIHSIGFSGQQTSRLGPFVQTRRSPLDERSLRRIAEMTGGQFFAAQSAGELDQIYTLLDRIEPIEVDELSVRPQRELFIWPLAAALFLALIIALPRPAPRAVSA